MKIAILGGSSLIAKDLTQNMVRHGHHEFVLYARRPTAVSAWLKPLGLAGVETANLADFGPRTRFDAVINCIGVGNPLKTAGLGSAILDTTLEFDKLATAYQQCHPTCRHLFFSSGAAYGRSFENPVDEDSPATLQINNLGSQDWYAMAKLYAEARHRALAELPIIDIRIFNYFSSEQDLSARFLMTDIVQAIHNDVVLVTSGDYIVRDYIAPADLHQLVERLLAAPPVNTVVDCYSAAPVDKLSLLQAMQHHFGLRYEVTAQTVGVNATGLKPHYYSRNRRAAEFGYAPAHSSLDSILGEVRKVLLKSTPTLRG